MPDIDAVLFDAYGTLFNVHAAAARLAHRLGPEAARLSELWRLRQVEYTWLQACMEQYSPFWQVTAAALDYAFEAVGLHDDALKGELLDTYRQVEPYPGVVPSLVRLGDAGLRKGVFSNADPQMLQSAVQVAGLDVLVDAVISVDDVGTFKPRPQVYAHAVTRVGGTAAGTGFVSANGWDAAGAAAAGLYAVWVNRSGAPVERLPTRPSRIVASLEEAVEVLVQ